MNRELTAKEKAIVELAVLGLTNKEIAKELGHPEQVIKNYLKVVYDKLGVDNRVRLILHYYARPIAEWNHARRHSNPSPKVDPVHVDSRG